MLLTRPDRFPSCHRAFFALRPPADMIAAIVRIRDVGGSKAGRVADDRLHLTLAILDDLPALTAPLIGSLRAIGDAIRVDAPEIVLDRVVGAGSHVCLRPRRASPELRELQQRLIALLCHFGIPPRAGWQPNPHVTLNYGGMGYEDRAIAPIRWRADDFVLIDSHVGRTHHEELGRWPLMTQPALL